MSFKGTIVFEKGKKNIFLQKKKEEENKPIWKKNQNFSWNKQSRSRFLNEKKGFGCGKKISIVSFVFFKNLFWEGFFKKKKVLFF